MPGAWNVLDHGPLVRLEDDLWTVDGAVPRMPLRRRMTVIRRRDGSLVIHNAIALREEQQRELEALGDPAVVIVPSAMHRLDAPAYKRRYPEIRVLAPSRGRRKVAEVVEVDGTFDDLPVDPSLRAEVLAGQRVGEACFVVTSGTRVTLVFNDAFFNHVHCGGPVGLAMRLVGSTGGPKVTKLFQRAAVTDRAAFRDHLLRLAATPHLHRIVPGHGDVIEQEPARVLREAAERLK